MPFILAGLILLFGSFVQGTIGFALGLIAVPLLIGVGFSLAQSVALMTVASGIQSLFGASQMREHIPWQDVKLGVLIRYLTVPVGILLLVSIDAMDAVQVKRFVGLAVLVGIILRLIPKSQQQRDLPLWATIGTFGISGIFQGLVAMGGPPIILWMTTRDYTAKQARAFTLTLFMFNAPVQVLLLFLLSDSITPVTIATAFVQIPLIFIGTTFGVRVGNRFSKPRLNMLAITVLLIIALNAIL